MTTATTEKIHNMTEQMTETWMQSFGTLCWAQEQGDRMVRNWLDQGKITRDESQKIMAKLTEQTKANQEAMQRFIQTSVHMSLESFRLPKMGQVDELTTKIEELNKKIEELNKKVESLKK